MKIKVVRAFHEAVGCPAHKTGEIMECSEGRAKELIEAGFCVAIEEKIEKVEKPKTKRTIRK